MPVTFAEKPQMKKNKQFKETKTWISYSYFIRHSVKETVINREMPSLNEGSLEITLTLPVSLKLRKFVFTLIS